MFTLNPIEIFEIPFYNLKHTPTLKVSVVRQPIYSQRWPLNKYSLYALVISALYILTHFTNMSIFSRKVCLILSKSMVRYSRTSGWENTIPQNSFSDTILILMVAMIKNQCLTSQTSIHAKSFF